MLEPDVIERIRRIFLQVRPHVSIRTAAWLLGWSWEEMTAAIRAGEVELVSTPLGKWFPRNELIAKGLEAWPLDVIEDALGDDAARVLPEALRTAELRVRLPRFQIDMLRYFARQEATTVSAIVSGELDHLANANLAELSAKRGGICRGSRLAVNPGLRRCGCGSLQGPKPAGNDRRRDSTGENRDNRGIELGPSVSSVSSCSR